MKNTYVTFAIASLFFVNSCTKDTGSAIPDTPTPNTPNPPTPSTPKADTLTLGWKKIVIDSSEIYNDVFFYDNTTGYLAGNKTYKSTDGGLTWNTISNQSFINLAVTKNGNAFFVGSKSGLFKSLNGTGPLVKVVSSPTSQISDVFFVDDSRGYYLDANGLFNSTDGGENWIKLTTTGIGLAYNVYPGLFFINDTTGWITALSTMYKTNGSATNWVAGSFTGTAPVGIFFTSVFSTLDHTVYTFADNGQLFKSIDGGTTFSLIQTFKEPGSQIGDIYFVDNNTGYVSRGNKIYKTTDAGSTWSAVATLANTQIIETYFSDAHHGWASCTNGTLLIYNN